MGRHKRNIEAQLINERRVVVASLMAQGLTQRAIAKRIAAKKIVNPETGNSYDLATIHRDIDAVREDWHKDAAQTIQQWKDEQVAQLRELIQRAYDFNRFEVVRGCIDLLIKLTGTAEAEKIDLSVRPTKTYLIVSPEDWTDKHE